MNIFYLNAFYNVIYSCDEFSASLLQSSASHDPSEVFCYADLLLKKHLWLSLLKTVVLLNIFVETMKQFFIGMMTRKKNTSY